MPTVLISDANDVYASIAKHLELLNVNSLVKPGTTVFLKPNLTFPTHRPGVTTSPRFIRAAINAFSDYGARVSVGEGDGGYGAWSADVSFAGHDLNQICQDTGASLINLSKQTASLVEMPGSGHPRRISLPEVLLEDTDVFVTLPVPKIHAMTHYSGAVKNQWGCIPDKYRLKLHPRFNDIIWGINKAVGANLAIGDGTYMLDRTGPMEGDAIYMNRVITSDDILSFDATVSSLLMHLEPQHISYLTQGTQYGYRWTPDSILDDSTGPRHRFGLKRSLRHKITAEAFPRQWAVNLLWFSPLGEIAHKALYKLKGNEVATHRRELESFLETR